MNNREVVDLAISTLSANLKITRCKDCAYGEQLPDRVRCELMDYLPFDFEDFCSEGVNRVNGY